MSRLINIGFGNMVSAGRLIAIVSPESAPIKRIVQEARDNEMIMLSYPLCSRRQLPDGIRDGIFRNN